MKEKLNVLYLTSENTTTSIPLELANYLQAADALNVTVVTYYGRVKGEPSGFSPNVIDLNISKFRLKQIYTKINNLIKDTKPDVLHVHHNVSALISIIIAKKNKVKVIVKTEHNDHRFLKWHQKLLNIPILFLADVVICNSVSTRNSFYTWEKLLAGKKAVPIYNGINVNKILAYSGAENIRRVRAKYGVADNEQMFFCAARLIKQKNIDNLIRAFASATHKNSNIKLLIAGNGSLYNDLAALKNELDVNKRIEFLGILPREEVFNLMNAADFFAVVSLWEGFCNAAVEAMIAGCPVLCSDIVTLREVVGEGTGYFANPESIESIEERILELASLNGDKKEEAGRKSFERAFGLYNIEKTRDGHIKEYFRAYASKQ